eukprot:TRINITY_DN6828_c0_g1_i1.p1 TRINITY_DN6828_c0_g1~~TRINITY_DN6828_c0_g1_i1.p1  ORF type:complete len:607 (+),score=112.81 TRINITY_DN6828_c0_g1_i1:86-1906(+)
MLSYVAPPVMMVESPSHRSLMGTHPRMARSHSPCVARNPTRKYHAVAQNPMATPHQRSRTPAAPRVTQPQAVGLGHSQRVAELWRHSYVPQPQGHSFVPMERPRVMNAQIAQIAQAEATSSAINENVKPWLEAAKNFTLNADFDLYRALHSSGRLDLKQVMDIMKQESFGKRTIQALADKIMLHKLLANLGVPQLDALLIVQSRASKAEVARFIDKNLSYAGAKDVVLKPTHLSNGQGVLVLSQVKPEEREATINYLVNHIDQFLTQHASSHESLALQSLHPGFLVQPCYKSVIPFKAPMELRVIALWGKVRLAVWWWGRNSEASGEAPQRNVWFVRRLQNGQITDDDEWEVLHEHQGHNQGFENAIAIFRKHMAAMAATTELIANSFGAPFLRADFFAGCPKRGVRLNEVAYGCGVDYKAIPSPGHKLLDDAPSIAYILQEGMKLCRSVLPPEHFLGRVGATGRSYADLKVFPRSRAVSLVSKPSRILRDEADEETEALACTEDLCKTVRLPFADENFTPNARPNTVAGFPLKEQTFLGAQRVQSSSAMQITVPMAIPQAWSKTTCVSGSGLYAVPAVHSALTPRRLNSFVQLTPTPVLNAGIRF